MALSLVALWEWVRQAMAKTACSTSWHCLLQRALEKLSLILPQITCSWINRSHNSTKNTVTHPQTALQLMMVQRFQLDLIQHSGLTSRARSRSRSRSLSVGGWIGRIHGSVFCLSVVYLHQHWAHRNTCTRAAVWSLGFYSFAPADMKAESAPMAEFLFHFCSFSPTFTMLRCVTAQCHR